MSKKVALTRGLFAVVDDEDFERVNQHKWYAAKPGRIWYARRGSGGKKTQMHRFIMGVNSMIDHIDGNGLNNQKSNLRLCTHQQNIFNERICKNNTSGYRGVTLNKKSGKWVAQIWYNGKIIRLGHYSKIIDAARTYDEAAKELFGEFANLNIKG